MGGVALLPFNSYYFKVLGGFTGVVDAPANSGEPFIVDLCKIWTHVGKKLFTKMYFDIRRLLIWKPLQPSSHSTHPDSGLRACQERLPLLRLGAKCGQSPFCVWTSLLIRRRNKTRGRGPNGAEMLEGVGRGAKFNK